MYTANNPSTNGNPDIDPEIIKTVELLVGYNFQENIKTSITYFYTKIDDLIQKVGGAFDNHGEIESTGIEIDIKFIKDINKYLYFNLTYQDVKNTTNTTITDQNSGTSYTQEDFNVGRIPSIIANIGLNYNIVEYMITNVSLNYTGKRERSGEKRFDENGNLVDVDPRDKVAARTLLNASLTFRDVTPSLKGLELQLSGHNLLDNKYKDPDPSGAIENDVPRAGVYFMGKLSYLF